MVVYRLEYTEGSKVVKVSEFDNTGEVYRISTRIEDLGGTVKVIRVEDGVIIYETPRKFWRRDVTEKQ